MLNRHFATAVDAARRAVPALGLAGALVLATLGPPTPVGAAADPEDLAARLQIVVKEIYILDDRDWWGAGELTLLTRVVRCPDATGAMWSRKG